MQKLPKIVLTGNFRLVLINLYTAMSIINKVGNFIPIRQIGTLVLFLLANRQLHLHRQRASVFHIHLKEIQRISCKSILILIGNNTILVHLKFVAELLNG